MKIAMIGPLVERIPPKKYGGTERLIHPLVEELVKMGHDVTLFASGDSQTSAKLSAVIPKCLREMNIYDDKELYYVNYHTMLNIGSAYARQDEFDVIHDHHAYYAGLPIAHLARTPVVMTMHGPFLNTDSEIYKTFTNPHIVTISKAQARLAPYYFNHLGTVYNGLEMSSYPFSEEHDGYLLVVGRICQDKGIHNAIEIAKRLNKKLIIAAKLDRIDIPYFKKYVEPELNDQIEWIGEVGEEERNKLMMRALCLLHPIEWNEPFGLTLIEAMACGCPVVAIGMGSIPEVVAHGQTGYVGKTIDELVGYVEQIDQIDRAECRRYALTNFSAKRMAEGYVEMYTRAIQLGKLKGATSQWSVADRSKLPLVANYKKEPTS